MNMMHIWIVLPQFGIGGLGEHMDLGARILTGQTPDHRGGEQYIAYRTKPDKEDA
jgi:hypothetical protein